MQTTCSCSRLSFNMALTSLDRAAATLREDENAKYLSKISEEEKTMKALSKEKKALEEQRKPTCQELEGNYACFWERALTKLSKPVTRHRQNRRRRLASQCSWPTEPLPESEAAAIKDEFTIASLARKVQVALSKAHSWPYPRALHESVPSLSRHSVCSWPTPKLHDTQAARYKILFSHAVERRRTAVVLSKLRAYGVESAVVLLLTPGPMPASVLWLNKHPLLATSGRVSPQALTNLFRFDLQAAIDLHLPSSPRPSSAPPPR